MNIFIENEFNQQKIWRILSRQESLLNVIENDRNFNLFHICAYYGLDELFLRILTHTQGEGLLVRDKKGRTPIHHLASNGRNHLLQILLIDYKEYFNLEQQNYKGRTALHSAAKHLHLDTVQILIEAGANVNICDNDDNTPLSLTFHRHLSLDNAILYTPVYDYLLTLTNYWQSRCNECEGINFNQDEDILIAWFLGSRFAKDRHWLPRIEINIRDKKYIVENFYQNEISTFVILENNFDRILLCMSKSDPLCINNGLQSRLTPNYRNSILNKIQNMIQGQKAITQIWGIEFAGIEAQLLAAYIEGTHKIILINSPGLPENLLTNDSKPNICHYIFSQDDKLHLNGKYAWANEANFYRYNHSQFPASVSKYIPPYKNELKRIQQRQLGLSSSGIRSLERISYTEGENYIIKDCIVIRKTNQEKIEELYNEKSLYLQNSESELFNFARFEYCAHGIGYLHLPHNHIMKWWDVNALINNQIISHNIPLKHVIHHQGLYCYLFQCNQELIIIFQGTDLADNFSLQRDLNRASAGIKRIRHQYLDIIQNIAHEIEHSDNQEINLFICGHSLGGSDAQNFFISMLAYLAKTRAESFVDNKHWMKFHARNTPYYNLNKIKEVHLYSYNAAGIRKSSASLAKAAASKLQDVKITINHQRVKQDFINIVGETILHEFDTNQEHVTVRNLFFSGRDTCIERIKNSHFDKQFVNDHIENYTLYENQQAQNSLEEELKLEPHDSSTYNTFKTVLDTRVFPRR